MATRNSHTIPGSGVFTPVTQGGVAIYVESAAFYKQPSEYPTIHFSEKDDLGLPIKPGYTLPAVQPFDRFWIQGTPESDGETVWLIVIQDICESGIFKANQNEFLRGNVKAGQTFSRTATDVGQQLLAAEYTLEGVVANAMTVTAVNEAIRYAFYVGPNQSDRGHYLAANDNHRIVGADFIEEFRFINATNIGGGGTAADVTFTMEF